MQYEPRKRGRKHNQFKLKEQERMNVGKDYLEKKLSVQEIMDKYGLTPPTIRKYAKQYSEKMEKENNAN